MDKDSKSLLNAAIAKQQGGDMAGAERGLRTLLKKAPDLPEASYLLGVLCLNTGRAAESEALITRAIDGVRAARGKVDPLWLTAHGAAKQTIGDLEGATRAFDEALALDGRLVDALFWRSDISWRQDRRDDAIGDLRKVLRLQPDHPRAAGNLGMALHQSGRIEEALEVMRPAVERQPKNPSLLFNYGLALHDAEQVEAAADALRKYLILQPDSLAGHIALVAALISLGSLEAANGTIEQGLARWPDNTALLSYRSVAMIAAGDRKGARKVLRRVLELDPACVPAHAHFAVAGGDMDDSEPVSRIEALLARGDYGAEERSLLHFTAGRRLDRLGRTEEAFEHVDKGNEAKREAMRRVGRVYNASREEEIVRELIDSFDPSSFRADGGSDNETPVFIVGMPRSGTSLVEQIIASHPKAFGAGERLYINQAAIRLRRESGYPRQPVPQLVLSQIAEEYLERLRGLAGDALRVTDKMPTNFRNLGLIVRLFPKARVVHTRRDPLDTCLSCYFQSFSGTSNAFIYSQEWLAHFYRLYLELMDHWRSVLPLDILEVDYESLVNDQEAESRRLISFIGLDWDDACLDFHKTERAVLTVSQAQVRQPMYNSSVGAWRRYETQLEPLAAALGPACASLANTDRRERKTLLVEGTDMTQKCTRLNDQPTFSDILSPMAEEDFFAAHYDRKPAHIEGGAEKFATVMSWDGLTSILDMTAVWSSSSLQLVHNKDIVPPLEYCRTAENRDGQTVLQPDAAKVMRLLQRGASLVANDIDSLTPALRGVASALEGALSGKAQANLYCSWEEHQGFGSHFDTHDVYAMHIAGEKLWRIYETRAEAPIAHPQFKSYGQEWHDTNRGKIAQEILMRPGDLLYLPRGQYHDAIATSDGTIHIAFGVTHVIGMDMIDLFAGMAVNDPLFRRNMPRRSDDEAEAGEWLAALGDRMAAYARTPDAITAVRKYQQEFRYPRGGFDLPVAPPATPYRLTAKNLKVEQRNGAWILAGRKAAVPIPAGLEEPVSWILSHTVFTQDDLRGAFPQTAPIELETLLKDLAGMKVVAPGS